MRSYRLTPDHELQPILQTIVEHLHQQGVLQLVLLFGSRATGTATRRSDIDLLAVYEDFSEQKILFPPEGIPYAGDILAFPEKTFHEGLINGKGLFIEAMTRGCVLFGDPSVIQKYQTQAEQTILRRGMIRTKIGWKRTLP